MEWISSVITAYIFFSFERTTFGEN